MWGQVFLNRYRAIRLLGEGGMGRAYLARQLDGDRLVVVKVLPQKYASTPHYREAIRREIDLLSQFHHPGVVELYEASMSDPQGPCLVMEYVQGEPPDALTAGLSPGASAGCWATFAARSRRHTTGGSFIAISSLPISSWSRRTRPASA